jgi:hypothetical protein
MFKTPTLLVSLLANIHLKILWNLVLLFANQLTMLWQMNVNSPMGYSILLTENLMGFGDPVEQSSSTVESPKPVYVLNDLMHAKLSRNNARSFIDEAITRSELFLKWGQISVLLRRS